MNLLTSHSLVSKPWKFIVYQGDEKDKLVEVMQQGINAEKISHELMSEWAFAIPDAENTVRIMQEAPCLIAVLNTNQKTPFSGIENEKRIVEICDSLSIGAAIQNMILTATGYGLGTLWIANTCFAYNELMDFIGTDSQLTGIVAVGFADEAPDKKMFKNPFAQFLKLETDFVKYWRITQDGTLVGHVNAGIIWSLQVY